MTNMTNFTQDNKRVN